MKPVVALTAALLLQPLLVPSLTAQAVDYSNCPACTSQDIQFLHEITTKYQGIEASNPKAPSSYGLVGTNKFNNMLFGTEFDTFNGDNWLPIRREKQSLCGTFDRFGIARWGDENDWNIHVVPSPGFEDFIADAIPYKKANWHGLQDDWGVATNGQYTIELEITPDSSRYGNPWFPNSKETPLLGKNVCGYGPFVREESHGNRPEIHPSEIIWWKDSDDKTIVLMVTDDSNRFNDNSRPLPLTNFNSDYRMRNVTDPNWVAWTLEKDQQAEISIPFEINVATEAQYLKIHALQAFNFSRNAAHRDATPGTKHTVTFRGAPVLTVDETNELEAFTSVNFKKICFDAGRGVLQGFVVVSTFIGNGDGDEGFIGLQLEKRKAGLDDKPAIVVGDLAGTWKTHALYNGQFAIDDVRSSDQFGKGLIDGFIDFNGNGKTDLFVRTSTGAWRVLYDGKGAWQELNNSGFPLSMLRFGDLNNDRRTDILINNDGRLQVSYGGRQTWTTIKNIGRGDVQVGDFNGDGVTDLVRMQISATPVGGTTSVIYRGVLRVMWSGRGDWRTLQGGFNLTAVDDYAKNFRLGDFNGDGVTDLFRYYNQRFMVYWNATGDFRELQRPSFTVVTADSLMFVKSLTTVGKTDIIHVNPVTKQWIYNYGGLPGSIPMTVKFNDPETVRFGDLDADPAAEPFSVDFVRVRQRPDEVVLPDVPPVVMQIVHEPDYKPGSLRRAATGNQLVVDYTLKRFSGPTTSRDLFRIMGAADSLGSQGVTYRPVSEATTAAANGPVSIGEVVAVPIGRRDNSIVVTARPQARTRRYAVPAYSIAAMTATSSETPGDGGAWETWNRLLTTSVPPEYRAIAAATPPAIETIKAIAFELHPFYASIEDGQVGIAETAVFVQELNQIVHGNDPAKITALFGSASPFRISWAFELLDATTGALLPIDSATVTISDGRFSNSKVVFAFPANNSNLLQLRARVEVTDSFGNRLERTIPYEFWNQRLRFNDPSQISAWLKGVNPATGTSFQQLEKRAAYFAEDGLLKPNELLALFAKLTP